MAPSLISTEQVEEGISRISLKEQNGHASSVGNGTESSYHTKGPIRSTGALDQYESFDLTPVIGREFPHANLVEWLESPNADELLRELALISMTSAHACSAAS